MEPAANEEQARRMVAIDGKTHGGAEIPEEKQAMAGTLTGNEAG